MKKALIFGISGQDGSYLAALLLDKGYTVFGVSRDAQRESFGNLLRLGILERVTLHSATLNDFRSTLHVINKTEPDEIYNLAGQSSVGLSFEQPAETMESISLATLNLLEAIRFINPLIRYYSASSTEIFGDTGQHPADEQSLFRPRSPYAVAKAAAFWQVANYRDAYGLYVASGILSNHESPLRPQRFVTRKIVATACRIADGSGERLLLGNIDIVRDWGWAPDYVDAIWRILQQEQPDDYLIATGESHALAEFVRLAFSTLGLDWREYTQTDAKLLRPADIRLSYVNPVKAWDRLGWSATVRFPELIRRLVTAEQHT